MHAATYARSIGRVVAFSLAAFRQAFAGGRALSSEDAVVIAGSGCEMHPKALLDRVRDARDEERAGARDRARGRARRAQRSRRVGAGRRRAAGRVFDGRDCLERAAAACAAVGVMRAKAAYELTVTRTGRAPGRLAAPDRVDHIEVVSVDDLEVVLFWDVPGRDTGGWRPRCAPTWNASTPRSSSGAGRPSTRRPTSARCLAAGRGRRFGRPGEPADQPAGDRAPGPRERGLERRGRVDRDRDDRAFVVRQRLDEMIDRHEADLAGPGLARIHA